MRRWLSRLGGLFYRSRHDREFAAELDAHLQAHADDNIRGGMSAAEAHRQARLTLGGADATKERYREQRGLQWLGDLGRDLTYALRTIRRSPGFAFVAVVSLAIGIGANTLVFSVLNGLVLQPLPIAQPDRVVSIQPKSSGYVAMSFPAYRDLRDRNVTFDGVFAYRMAPIDVEANGAASRGWGYLATGNYFDVLGVRPALGRFFTPAEDRQPGAAPLCVLSHAFWTSHFAADPAVVGTTIRINRLSYTVLGVAPPGFVGTEVFFRPQLWVPMMMEPQIEVNPWLERRGTTNTWVAGRLKAGVSARAAESNLNAIGADLGRQYPDSDRGLDFKLSKPGLIGDALRAPARAFTIGVLVLAGLVLLTACANLASTFGARSADRAKEIAVRLSIGASRGRIVRQLLTETLLVAATGGALGYAAAYAGASALSRWQLPIEMPVQLDVQPDARVFLFTLTVSIVAGLLFGLAPARQASSVDTTTAFKNTSGVMPGRRRRWALRDILVSAQVALCVVLVASCLLSLNGLRQALSMPLGFQPAGVSRVSFELHLAGYTLDQQVAFQQRALEAVRRLPGVTGAAYTDTLPLNLNQNSTTVYAERQASQQTMNRGRSAAKYAVSPGFFDTLGMTLRAGRYLDERDTGTAPRVAVVNETFVRNLLRTTDPVGRRFRTNPTGPLIEVVGVVADGKYQTLSEAPVAAVFNPILQDTQGTTTLLARSSMPTAATVAQMRQAVQALDPSLPLFATGSLNEMLALALFPSRAAATALTTFGLLALALATTGIYGMVAYAVARRRREIGIRIAIGARRLDIVRLVLSRIAALVAAGSVAGLALALLVGPLLTSIVYQTSPRDPLLLAAVVGIVSLVSVLASSAPTVRSLRIEPVAALRSE